MPLWGRPKAGRPPAHRASSAGARRSLGGPWRVSLVSARRRVSPHTTDTYGSYFVPARARRTVTGQGGVFLNVYTCVSTRVEAFRRFVDATPRNRAAVRPRPYRRSTWRLRHVDTDPTCCWSTAYYVERTQHARVSLRIPIRSFCRARAHCEYVSSLDHLRSSYSSVATHRTATGRVRLALGGGSASAVTSQPRAPPTHSARTQHDTTEPPQQQHPAHSPLRASRAMTRFIAQGSRFAAASSPWRACGRILPATPCSSEHHACCSA